MKFEEVLQESAWEEIPDKTVIGIDIGSRQAKAVLLHKRNIYTALIPTGFFMKETADELIQILFREGKVEKEDIDYLVVTGYGRVALTFTEYPFRTVTEIACHGKGAHYLGENVQTIIDIGGQDSKAIKIDPADGKVVNFAMNDKCAAGTGRFLEKISNVLGYDVEDIGEVSLKADQPTPINSTCVVFAESEVVSGRAKGESVSNLSAGIHKSVAKRVYGLLNRVGIESNVLFTGGVSNNVGMKKAFEDLLNIRIAESRLNTVFAGALGAAAFAAEFAKNHMPAQQKEEKEETCGLDLSSFKQSLQKAHENYIHKNTGKKAYVAYTCNYTPIEVLAAADVAFMRLLHRGTQEEIIAGETLTQSMICDHTKSIIGGFIKGTAESRAIEKLYTFYTCACMRGAIDAIGRLYVPTVIYNLPRKRHEASAKTFLASEIKEFKEDLEQLTGESISEETILENIRQYNQAKQYIREIAAYRKTGYPLLTSRNFQDIIKGYYTLPVQELLSELKAIKKTLQETVPPKKKKLRLMLSGGIVADGDDKITRIIEEELGAVIVVEDNCTGIRPLDFDVKEDGEGDVYERLAEGYLGKAPCARMYPVQEMVQNSLNLAKEYHVDGVILYHLKFCACYSMVGKVYNETFRQNNIPLLVMSGDYSVGDEGQIKTRLEAFLEILQEREGE